MRMWLARRDRNAAPPYRPGLCLGGVLAVLLAPPGPGGKRDLPV